MPGPIGPTDRRASGLVISQDERGWVSQVVARGERIEGRGASAELVEASILAQLVELATAQGVVVPLLGRSIPSVLELLA
jgi:hypothetical protein